MFIGGCIYSLVCLFIGESFSIEKVIFNEYSNTKLGFFSGSEANNFIEKTGVKSVLNEFFDFFTGVTILVYLIVLVYMAIRIMLGSTAEKGSKYKELLLYWVEGVAILFLFPYVMKYSIQINESFIAANKTEYFEEPTIMVEEVYNPNDNETDNDEDDKKESEDIGLANLTEITTNVTENIAQKTDYMSIMYNRAKETGWLVLAICWFVMFIQMFGFLVIYFKRVLVMIFLIAIFPLVMISYAIDKIGDAKSQAFGAWVNEFMVNVFIQSFHAIAYVLIMSVIFELMDSPSDNWLLILIAITFISKGDDILRGIFSLNSKANTVKGISATMLQAVAIGSIAKGLKSTK